MGLRLNLLVVGVFLLSLRSIQAKSPTFTVVGAMHCTDCINNRNSSQGFEVVIKCNANEMRARGNGGVDERGKFNVTLSAETAEDSGDADGCYAKLQSRSGAPCHIQAAQTASVKIFSNSTININRPTAVIKFSPITCQSAFFWHFPNLTFFGSKPRPSPPDYTPPPTAPPKHTPPPTAPPKYTPPPTAPPKSTPPPAASSVQPPSPSPQPSYDTPAPSLPPTVVDAPSPPPSQPPTSSPSPTLPPSSPVHLRRSPPPQNGPIQSPVQTQPPSVIAPTPASLVRPAPAAGISQRRPNPIPKAPPIPELPVTPSVPRKYFNPPKSRSKPPRSL